MQGVTDKNYEDLANAIVRQAADDYRRALRGKGYRYYAYDRLIREIERFFRSRWYRMLTHVNGEYLLEKLREEHEEERRKHESNFNSINA